MLYHFEIGFPFAVNLPETMRLHYSEHAKKAAQSDRYGFINLETVIKTEGAKVIEVETDDRTKQPIKVVIRKNYDQYNDICIVILLNKAVSGGFLVKTVWLNSKFDAHKTLDHARYAKVSQ